VVKPLAIVACVVAGLAGLVGLVGACALFDDGPPENECETSMDCFRAQGEVCNPETKMCEPRMDAGVDAP
jgi:hypothetical protein